MPLDVLQSFSVPYFQKQSMYVSKSILNCRLISCVPKSIIVRPRSFNIDKTCDNFNDTAAKVERVTVALSRLTNLKDETTSAKLYHHVGQETSVRPDN